MIHTACEVDGPLGVSAHERAADRVAVVTDWQEVGAAKQSAIRGASFRSSSLNRELGSSALSTR